MKIVTVVGTRPNFIKITQLEKELCSQLPGIQYQLIHTGQHYDYNMSRSFFTQLKIRDPDVFLNVKDLTPGEQVGVIIQRLSRFLAEEKPDLLLVPGDVNSTMAAAIAANKTKVSIGHIESGLRSFDRSMPEEINRMITDQLADIHFVTEESGLENLKNELPGSDHVYFVGNTMIDTLVAFENEIEESSVLERLEVTPGSYILITIHRPSNVDDPAQLKNVIELIKTISQEKLVIFPAHPRTVKNVQVFGLVRRLGEIKKLKFIPPEDYFSFQKLIKEAFCVITDSGGIQEETTYRKVPCLTLRENTERPVTIKKGTNELVGLDPEIILNKLEMIELGKFNSGEIPKFWDGFATKRIVTAIRDFLN